MSDVGTFLDALPFLRNALVAGIVIGALASTVGCYFVLRRMLLLGITIPQVSSAGIACMLLVQGLGLFGLSAAEVHLAHGPALIGALAFTLAGILVLGTLAQRRPDLADISIGFTFAVSSAMSILLLSQSPMAEASMLNLLKGEIIATTDGQLLAVVGLTGFVFSGLIVCRKQLFLVSYDREFAISVGTAVALWDILFYLMAGVGVSLSVMTVGPVATFGYLALPAMIALRMTRTMTQLFIAAPLIGAFASVVALATAFVFDLPTGPTSVAFLAILFVMSSILSGLIRILRRARD